VVNWLIESLKTSYVDFRLEDVDFHIISSLKMIGNNSFIFFCTDTRCFIFSPNSLFLLLFVP